MAESDTLPGNGEMRSQPQVSVPSGRQTRKQRMSAQRKMFCDGLGFMAIFLSQFILFFIHSLDEHSWEHTKFQSPSRHWNYNRNRDDRGIYLLESSFPDSRTLRPTNVTLGPKSHLAVYGSQILNLYILPSSVLFPWEYLCLIIIYYRNNTENHIIHISHNDTYPLAKSPSSTSYGREFVGTD